MKKLITEAAVKELLRQGSNVLVVNKGSIITPLALDLIKLKKISVVESDSTNSDHSTLTIKKVLKKIVIGSDHTGFKIKNLLIKYLGEKGYEITDIGTFDEKPCDYPDFAKSVAENVISKKSDCGIMIDASGIPSAITANKIKSIRAATCYNEFSAKSSREHNDANILVLGARALGEESIKSIVDVWINTPFAGGRHQKRLDKIKSIEDEEKDR
ncbi:MAG TPA: ribose 5-phosphate isomerase B [Ignavibacteriaceae bacterium]|jgi:ribose 5-phosphate isomerase B